MPPAPPTPRSLWTKRALAGVCAILICVVAYLVLQLGLAFTPDEPVVASTRVAKPRPAPPTKPAPPANEAELEKTLLDSMHAARDKLEAARRPIPEEQNSAVLIARATPLIPKEAFSNIEYLIGIGLLSPAAALNDKQLTLLKNDLESCAEALTALQTLPELTNGRCPPSEKLFDADQFKHSRRVADLQRWRAILQAHRQEVDAALISSRAILNAGRSIGDDPALMAQLVRLACQGMTASTLERILGQGTPSAQNLKAAQTQLEEETKEPLFLITAHGEREMQLALFAKIEALDVPVPTRMLWFNDPENGTISVDQLKSTHRSVRRLTFELVRLAKRPAHEWWNGAADIKDEYNKATPLEQALLQVKCTILPKSFVRAQARLRCAVVGLAVERYRLAHQRWPENLDQLRPAFLAEVPLDPFSGKAIQYHHTDDGVVLFSVGPEENNDLAKVLMRSKEHLRYADLVFQLWDPERRRQPAPPPKKMD